jgi:cell division septation protein DedD
MPKKYNFAFSGKEIFIVFSFIVFIGLLLLTLGMMLGKSDKFGLSFAKVEKKALEETLNAKKDEDTSDLTADPIANEEKDTNLKSFENNAKKGKAVAAEQKPSSDNPPSEEESLVQEEPKAKAEKEGVKANKNLSMSSDEFLSNRGKYTVQVAAFAKETEAESKTMLLRKTCCKEAYYIEGDVPGKGLWYQVRIGIFDKLSNAKSFAAKLQKQRNISEYVIKVIR